VCGCRKGIKERIRNRHRGVATLKYILKESRMNIGEGTMVKLTADMKEAFGKMKVFPVATASKDGTPNVIPLGIAELVSDDTVWFVDNFMNKTLSNLRVNPKIAFFVWGPDIKGCYQVKGVAALKTSGKEYDEMKAKINQKNPALPARSLVIVKITEIFECKPGPTAGVKIL
jgi:predicted pyridoxine 5'-phosphate oxidase superfamily flavin-nucleotide-binding protein